MATAHGAVAVINHKSGDLRQMLRAAFPDGVDVVVDPEEEQVLRRSVEITPQSQT